MYLNGHSTDVGNEFSLSIMYLELSKSDLVIAYLYIIFVLRHISGIRGRKLEAYK